MTWHSATLVACRPQHTAWSLLMTSLTRSQAAQLARGMLACATRRHARPQHPPLTALSLTALPSPLSCAGACRPLGASAQGSRPAACPESHHTQHWCRRRWRQRHAWILLCSLMLAAGSPGSAAGSPASSHPRAGLAVQRHGRCEAPRQQPGYSADLHACADPAVLQRGRPRATLAAGWVPCELTCMRRLCCAPPRPSQATQAAAWVPCELACTRRLCCAAAR